MAYNPAIPNSFDTNLIPFKVRERYFSEYIGLSPLSFFSGTDETSAIQIFEMNSGEGMSYRVAFKKEIDYDHPTVGFDQMEGQEQQISFFEDEIKLDIRRFADRLMGVALTKQMTPINVYEALRPALLRAAQRNLVKSILSAGTVDLYDSATQGPVKARALYAGVAYNETIKTGVTSMTGATNDKSGLSVKHIRKLAAMAKAGGTSFEEESLIKPVQLTSKRGFPEETFIYLIDPELYTFPIRII